MLALDEPRIVWANGPFRPSRHDLNVFRGAKDAKEKKEKWDTSALYFQIPEGKKLVGDGGYVGEPKIATKSREHPAEMREWMKRVLARQETMHTRLKNFNILCHRFRHGKNTQHRFKLHKMAVEAVCVLIQYDYENGHPPFDV